ncbi:MAG: DUF5678 domain-containing protein [archaeon]|nr:DUF5678 domain-containing protein [archaeon]
MKNLYSSKTYDFYANADLSYYAGEWVAIIGNKVVSHGKNAKQVLENVKKDYPKVVPFIAKVPSKIEDELAFRKAKKISDEVDSGKRRVFSEEEVKKKYGFK